MARELLANREAHPLQGLELAGWQFKSVNGGWIGTLDELGKNQAVREGCEVREVYAMTDSPNDRDAVREAHAEWSRSTFGNVGPIGPLKHLSKEALEAAAQPDDLSEWADMQFLLWDAQRRAGITDEQITQAMIEKLKVNMARQWPEPKDGEPRLHITAPPAPAVPDEKAITPFFDTLALDTAKMVMCDVNRRSDFLGGDTKLLSRIQCRIDNACRAAMLAQPVSQGCKLPDNVREALTLALQAMEFMGDTLNNIDAVCTEDVEYVTPAFTAVRGLLEAAPEVTVPTTKINCWSCGNHFTYVQHSESDGYCPHCDSPVDIDDEEGNQPKLVPAEPTESMIASAWREAAGKCDHETIKRMYEAMLAAAPEGGNG